MSFIQSFSINTNNPNPFPFNIPAVQFAKDIELNPRVTIFVGDNGSGKSTLLEALALNAGLPLIGGQIANHPGFNVARLLQPYLKIDWERQTYQGFFFRAEDFSDFINSVEKDRLKIAGDLG